ncbi:MAG TPA: hypothetical protein DDW52_12405 [Planctomycetaceae bacterium]|nr:hypothetical protein [Planctomycetaceae bacterium]
MTDPTWQKLFDQYRQAEHKQRRDLVPVARKLLPQSSKEEWGNLIVLLKDDVLKWFVAEIFAKGPIPKRYFEAFMRAAIEEQNPSFNRRFVEPCIKTFGHRKVNEYLLDVVETSASSEVAGAVAALYWANMSISFSGEVPEYTLEYATEESRSAFLELSDVWKRKQRLFLETFLRNEDVDVRRQIIPSLKLKNVSEPNSELAERVISIARSHSDEYIRHRVEVQLGNEHLLKPIPDRERG